MKIYIVYETEFDIDKPRNRDCKPDIKLITVYKDMAIKEYKSIKNEKIKMEYYIYDCKENTCFEFTQNPYYYGICEIISYDI